MISLHSQRNLYSEKNSPLEKPRVEDVDLIVLGSKMSSDAKNNSGVEQGMDNDFITNNHSEIAVVIANDVSADQVAEAAALEINKQPHTGRDDNKMIVVEARINQPVSSDNFNTAENTMWIVLWGETIEDLTYIDELIPAGSQTLAIQTHSTDHFDSLLPQVMASTAYDLDVNSQLIKGRRSIANWLALSTITQQA